MLRPRGGWGECCAHAVTPLIASRTSATRTVTSFAQERQIHTSTSPPPTERMCHRCPTRHANEPQRRHGSNRAAYAMSENNRVILEWRVFVWRDKFVMSGPSFLDRATLVTSPFSFFQVKKPRMFSATTTETSRAFSTIARRTQREIKTLSLVNATCIARRVTGSNHH